MTNPSYTALALIVDSSGSMRPLAKTMNSAITDLLSEQAKLPGELHVDVTVFESEVTFPYVDARADDVKHEIIVPKNMTALQDAIALTLIRLGERFAALDEEDRPGKVIVVIVTDGAENASKEYPGPKGLEAVKAMVDVQRDQYGWEFIFMGAESLGDVAGTAAGYGVGAGQTISFANTQNGTESVLRSASSYMGDIRVGQSRSFTEEERVAAADPTKTSPSATLPLADGNTWQTAD